MRFFSEKLRNRLVVFFMLLALCPLGVIGFVSYHSGRQSIINNVKSHLESVAILKEQQIEDWIEHLRHTLVWMTTNSQTKSNATILATHGVVDAKYRRAYESIVSEFRGITSLEHFSMILFIDSADGQVIASSDAAWEGKFRDAEPYFTQGKREIFVSEVFFSLALSRPTIVVSGPVKDRSGRLMGVMAAHVNLKQLSEIMLERSGLAETVETFLINQANLLLTNTVFAPKSAFNKWIFGQGAKWALEGKNGVGQFVDYRGEPVIGAYRWLEHRKMALIAKQDESEAFAPVTALRNTIIEIAIGVFLFVTAVGIFISRSITTPLEKLTKGTEIIGKGDLSHRVDVKTKDEIGILADAFNKMVSDLEDVTTSRDDLNTEITERKQAEEELAASEEFLTGVIEQSPISLWISDSEGTLIRMNQACRELFGVTDQEAVGKFNLFKDNLIEEQGFMSLVENVFEKGKIARFTIDYDLPRVEHVKVNGATYRILDVVLSPIKDIHGKVTNAIVQHKDITERKRAEEELEKHREHLEEVVKERTAELDKRISEIEQLNSAMMNLLADLRVNKESLELSSRQLKDANKELESFSYSVSHDLRAPLRAINGFSKILVEDYGDKLDDNGQHQLNVIRGSTRKMGQLIDDLLAFSRLGRKGISMSEIDMGVIAQDVFEQLQLGETERTARLKIDTLPPADGDRAMIREVFVNFLSNAMKFTRPGKALVIEVTGTVDENENVYSVKDNGVGFDMKYAEKLFQVFQRLHSAEEYEGTGIGLALVQRIIHRHDGRVWAEGKVNKGATFYFSLPRS